MRSRWIWQSMQLGWMCHAEKHSLRWCCGSLRRFLVQQIVQIQTSANTHQGGGSCLNFHRFYLKYVISLVGRRETFGLCNCHPPCMALCQISSEINLMSPWPGSAWYLQGLTLCKYLWKIIINCWGQIIFIDNFSYTDLTLISRLTWTKITSTLTIKCYFLS